MIDEKKIRILFFGTPEISSYVLENLIINGYNIIGVVARIDKPVGRKMVLEEVPTKKIAKKYNIPVYQFIKIKEHVDEIKELKPDLILTLAFGQIIPHDMLMIPKYGCLNLHGSILPKYRGASPIQSAILNGDKESGISLMEMVDEMDAGKVYEVEKVEIKDDDNYTSLNEKMKIAAFNCINKNLKRYLNGELIGVEQNNDLVTFTHKILSEDEVINFNEDASNINNKIRALSNKPGAYFIFNNLKFKVFKAEVFLNDDNKEVGTILKYNKKDFIIKCKNNALKILIIQKEGKKINNYPDFYNGNASLFKENDKI